MTLPNVGVVIANFNYGKWILDSIESVFAQDYPQQFIETVVVDDASTDESVKIVIDKYDLLKTQETKDYTVYNRNALSFISLKQNGGPSRARNVAISYLWDRVHLFAILDSDDVWFEEKISKSVAKMMEFPDIIGGVYTDYEIENVLDGIVTYEVKEPYSKERLMQDCIIHSGSIVSKNALMGAGGLYDESLRTCEDYDLWLRISDKMIFIHIPERLVRVRVTPMNSTDSVSQEVWKNNYTTVKQKMMARRGGR